jgi:hypothetical protein
MDTDPIRRIEDKVDALSWYTRCLHGWLTAGPHADREAVRRRLEEAARRLAPAGERLPVVSDPDGGPPVPS